MLETLPPVGRLLIEADPCDGPTNMARDEILLEQADRYGAIAMRWYRWDPATLSLGYFQDDDPSVLPEMPRVRRLSGGGAIVHDAEWTYSIATPRDYLSDARQLYADVHGVIVDLLAVEGLQITMRGIDRPEIDGRFLCFERGDHHDIVVTAGAAKGKKVVGSAQRRRGSAVLQHGSIQIDVPIERSAATSAEQPLSVAGTHTSRSHSAVTIDQAISMQVFAEAVAVRVANTARMSLKHSDWREAELVAARNWAASKYVGVAWSRDQRRGPQAVPRPSVEGT